MRSQGARLRGIALSQAVVLLAVLTVPARAAMQPAAARRSPETQQVYDALDRLRRAEKEPPAAVLRNFILTEQEMNAYIGHRIRTEKSGPLRELKLKFLPGSLVEGMIDLDLAGIGAPAFLPTGLQFFFSGRLMMREAQVKFEVEQLFLGMKPVPVFLLNLAFYIASKTQKHGSASLADWQDLPLGLKEVAGEKGRLILRY